MFYVAILTFAAKDDVVQVWISCCDLSSGLTSKVRNFQTSFYSKIYFPK